MVGDRLEFFFSLCVQVVGANLVDASEKVAQRLVRGSLVVSTFGAVRQR